MVLINFNLNPKIAEGAIVDLHFESGLMVMEAAGLKEAFKTHYMPGADKYHLRIAPPLPSPPMAAPPVSAPTGTSMQQS